ncbi:MAG: enoyl-CoA hydratase/isomerase family protein [Pseudomonadota bacterium]|nr:enoyl-CoA hydratase/isomerase family protein [Pseudomonadota bacterium]
MTDTTDLTDFRALVETLPPGPGRVVVTTGDLATIRFDHEPSRNALDPAMMVALSDAIEAVRDARVVVLSGAHRTFCSGGNLGAVRSHLAMPGAGRAFGAFMQDALDRLAALDAIVIAVVEGAALGGGAELVVTADLVVAAPDARIGFVHARLGVSPGFGGGGRLVSRVGPRAALQVLAFARVLGAAEAHAIDLVDEVDPDPHARADALATELLALPAAAVRGAKRVVRAAAPPVGRTEELEVFAELWGGPDHQRALAGNAREPRR